jgi:hypothetical protein
MAKSKSKGKTKSKGPAEPVEFELGVNCAAKLEGSKLTVVVDLDEDFGLTKKGKSHRVASTLGNKPIPGADPAIRFGINCYKLLPKDQRVVMSDDEE